MHESIAYQVFSNELFSIPKAIEVVSVFISNVEKDMEINLLCIFAHMPDVKNVVVATLYNDASAAPAGAACRDHSF